MHRKQLSFSLYLNYFVHGIGIIILTQNMLALSQHWHSPLATVSYVISGIGIGRFIAYFILGNLSDRFGRKIFVNLGMISYLIFFLGMAFVTNIKIAYFLAILAGIANSALDAGTYTTFLEMGGTQGSANVLLKAFISSGEFLLPLVVAMIEAQKMWYGWSFILAAIILVINLVLLNRQKFPPRNQASEREANIIKQISPIKKIIASIGLSGYGYTSMALMILYTQWISLFATKTFHFNSVLAHWLLSLYSIGSISGVIIIFILLKRTVAETKILIFMNVGSLLALLIICYSQLAGLSMLAAFVFGFTAAGGVLQVGLNLFVKLYPQIKGRITGIYFTFGSLASFTIPLITGWLSQQSIAQAMRFDLVIGLVGLLLISITSWAVYTPSSLNQERKRINQIDQHIIHLLNQRFDTVKAIGNLKQQQQLPILDQERENDILNLVAQKSCHPEHTQYMQIIYQSIMANSRAYQHKNHSDKENVNND
ncbi:MAG: MFS transporter [Lactobacillus sp.]|nr:MFS transporter [Lactobacillus sp.]